MSNSNKTTAFRCVGVSCRESSKQKLYFMQKSEAQWYLHLHNIFLLLVNVFCSTTAWRLKLGIEKLRLAYVTGFDVRKFWIQLLIDCNIYLQTAKKTWRKVNSLHNMNKIFHDEIPDLILIPSFTTLRICDFPDTPHHLHHCYISSYFIKIFSSRC